MPLPTIFANLTAATGAELDGNFAALGALTPLPCTVSGTNSLTLVPLSNTPTISAYANYALFSGVVAATNTGGVTAQVNALGLLTVYKTAGTGPAALTGGELVIGNAMLLMYDSALPGFHLVMTSPSISGSGTTGQVAVWSGAGSITGTGTTGTGNVVFDTGATIAAAAFRTSTAYTASTLPAATSGLRGSRAFITDASVSTALVGAAITGGGSNVLPVFCNGSAWVYG